MSGGRVPWWYSGDDSASHEDPEEESPRAADAGSPLPGIDWTVIAAGAQRLVDWASERVMAPHAEHTDPSEHPQCVVCRTMQLLGDRPAASAGEGQQPPAAPDGIAWIPIVEDTDEA